MVLLQSTALKTVALLLSAASEAVITPQDLERFSLCTVLIFSGETGTFDEYEGESFLLRISRDLVLHPGH
jgi:hypothetical protein